MRNIVFVFFLLTVTFACSKTKIEEHPQHIAFDTMHWYASRAAAAYLSPEEIRKAFPDTVRAVNLTAIDVLYFVEQPAHKQYQAVSVRGTNNFDNFRQDADFDKVQNAQLDIYVHDGFNSDALAVYADLKPHLDPTIPIRITGHSLGAAISTLLMMYLEKDGYTLERSVNFGQPKLTNHKGVQRYQHLPLLRVRDENDIVPLLPPDDFIDPIHGHYEHLGPEVILLEGTRYVYLPKHEAEPLSVDEFWRSLDDLSVGAHRMAHYIHNIVSKLKRAEQIPYTQRTQYQDM